MSHSQFVMKSCATLLLLLVQGMVLAGEDFYVGMGIGQAMTDGAADTDRTSFPAGMEPESFSIDSLPFDSNETTWSALLGWNITSWLGLEAGYRDFGNFGSTANFLSISGIEQSLALDVEEWSFGARLRYPLSSRFVANWFVGISRAEFEAHGSFPLITGIPFPSPIFLDEDRIPFSSPDNETGNLLGFGFEYVIDEPIRLELGYRRHDTKVLEIETFTLGLLYAF